MAAGIHLSTAVHLGEADGEDGVGAAAEVVHACAGCGAVGIAEDDQVLHVTVAVHQLLGQIYTQVGVFLCVRFSAFYTNSAGVDTGWRIKLCLTLYIGPVPGVLSHFQVSAICGRSSLLEKVLHTFIVDLQITGAKAETQMQNLIQDCTQSHKGTN